MNKHNILIVEDDPDWAEIVSEIVQNVLKEMKRLEEFELTLAQDYVEAARALKANNFILVSMDINLSGGLKGKSEGLDLLEDLVREDPDTCSIIVSAEKENQYFKTAFQKYNIVRFIEKAPWDANELKLTVKSIILYLDALRYLKKRSWTQAVKKWNEACNVFPELKTRFKNVGALVENATLNPITGLPAGKAVDTKLTTLLNPNQKWGLLYITVNGMREYMDACGHVAGNDALRAISHFLEGQLSKNHFIGQVEDSVFVLQVENRTIAESLERRVLDDFGQQLSAQLYNFRDIQKGYIETSIQKYTIPILTLTTHIVSDEDGPFTDIREISSRGSIS